MQLFQSGGDLEFSSVLNVIYVAARFLAVDNLLGEKFSGVFIEKLYVLFHVKHRVWDCGLAVV
jgi:hypothetical protein